MDESALPGDVSFDLDRETCGPEVCRDISARLEKDGVVVLRNLFSADEVGRLRQDLSHLARIVPPGQDATRHPIPVVWLTVRGHGNRLGALARCFRKPVIQGICDHYFASSWRLVDILNMETPPTAERIIHWHVDCSAPDVFMPDPAFHRVKVHCYLNDVTRENGAFAYVPGSHRWVTGIRKLMAEGHVPLAHTQDFDSLKRHFEDNRDRIPGPIMEGFRAAGAHVHDAAHSDDHFDIEGKAGTAMIFNEAGIHGANSVARGHRSVLRYGLISGDRFDRITSVKHRTARRVLKAVSSSPSTLLM